MEPTPVGFKMDRIATSRTADLEESEGIGGKTRHAMLRNTG
jgi:hypothetical protein